MPAIINRTFGDNGANVGGVTLMYELLAVEGMLATAKFLSAMLLRCGNVCCVHVHLSIINAAKIRHLCRGVDYYVVSRRIFRVLLCRLESWEISYSCRPAN